MYHAKAGAVETEEQFVGARGWDIDVDDFEVEVGAWVDYYACFAFLWYFLDGHDEKIRGKRQSNDRNSVSIFSIG